ncbi:MAG: hypothetical protein CMN44_03100 [SAR116 cluster bacterium]|nr:hypothetical protein [SAR116 cluster bacterium]RPH11113.1 MAG: polymer-forming cytoskeletal protein [Alphaproteobacteria bacterium TMED54]|tara:strand:- start:2046 stop:2459 length:414 start_codon:yes stop_codon:yes gene_type:complete
MIKINRITSPLKDKIKNIDTCSQLDGDGVFEGKYSTTGTIVLKNKFIGSLNSDQTIIDTNGIFEGDLKTEELIISGFVNGKVEAENIVIMETGKISGDITYNQLAVFEGGRIDVAGMKRKEKKNDEKVVDISNSNQN